VYMYLTFLLSKYLLKICLGGAYINSYLYIKDAKSFFDVPTEKLSMRPRQDNLKVVKGFRSHGVYNILCATESL
jgi:hypothetical protein